MREFNGKKLIQCFQTHERESDCLLFSVHNSYGKENIYIERVFFAKFVNHQIYIQAKVSHRIQLTQN